ncbi:MAG TPA: hypothetical protein VMZ52_00445, partial [Bryobacteraceae bacterium]|nr:hypothetical protein [Bryobacteraceae bacterium]
DIFAGNYWIRSPERFALPWRLFAINLYSEEPDSAMLGLAVASGSDTLAVAQGHRKEARLAIFQRPADPTQLWQERRLEDGLHLVRPHGLLAAESQGKGEFAFYVGEHAGAASRILLVPFDAPVREVARGRDVLALWRLESGQLLSVGSDNVSLWRPK